MLKTLLFFVAFSAFSSGIMAWALTEEVRYAVVSGIGLLVAWIASRS